MQRLIADQAQRKSCVFLIALNPRLFFAFKFQTSDVTDDYADDPATAWLALLDLLQVFARPYFGDPEESL